jgi:GxxExxY protein
MSWHLQYDAYLFFAVGICVDATTVASSVVPKEDNMSQLIHSALSHKVLGIAFKVHNIIGPGLHESAYEEAFCIELASAGVAYSRQQVFPIQYQRQYIGSFIADIVVQDTIILELKSVKELNPVLYAQIINYLKLSGLPVGLLVNFHGIKVEWKRFVNQKQK